MEKRNRILLFDFGAILVSLDKQRCIDALRKIGCGEIASYVDEHRSEDLFHKIELGGAIKNFCDEARQKSHSDATDNDICWAWNQLLTGIPLHKLRLIDHLHNHCGYRTAVLSNTNWIHWNDSQDYFKIDGKTIDDYFEHVFLSCDLKLVKPDARIYQEVLNTLHATPDHILFIDDSVTNCLGANACGISTIYDPTGNAWTEEKVATIGNFDGLHQGHQYVLSQLKAEANQRNMKSLVITFDRHPREIFQPEKPCTYISSLHDKMKDITHHGIDSVATMVFDKSFATLSARDFMLRMRDEMGIKVLLLGYDNRFGSRTADAPETFEDYKRLGEEIGIEVKQLSHYEVSGQRISSSLIRQQLREGDVEDVAMALGRSYTISGIVTKGHQKGREIGFPTANIIPDTSLLLPLNGVYATEVRIHDKAYTADTFRGVTNIGTRPTYQGHRLTVETHLIDFSGDIYDKVITVSFLHRIRDERHFSSPEELRHQITEDINSSL